LKSLAATSKHWQDEAVKKQTLPNTLTPLNSYQPGDLLLHDRRESRPDKLSPKYFGPYTVVSQYRNDVTVKHPITQHHEVFHLDRLHPFYGTAAEAHAAAMLSPRLAKELATPSLSSQQKRSS
jgi:hypothetical protein